MGATAVLALIPPAAAADGGGTAAPGSGGTTTTCSGSSGGTSQPSGCQAYAAPYRNPFRGGSWSASRIDMGVDYMPNRREAVRAIGDAKILGSSQHADWPGGGLIWYRLLDGDHAGDVVYVAEHVRRLLPRGTTVRAGQRIGTAIPGYPWTEWGWATRSGDPRAAPCYSEGMQTNSGREMARFLGQLGARLLRAPGPGSVWPTGSLC